MSFSSRLKECRLGSGLSRADLAKRLGITASAVANYENGISTPKADVLFLVFDALDCDANYLFQDEMSHLNKDIYTKDEEALVKKYRLLDTRGQQAVLDTLKREYEYLYEPIEIKTAARGGGVQIEKTTRAEEEELRRRVAETADEAAKIDL